MVSHTSTHRVRCHVYNTAHSQVYQTIVTTAIPKITQVFESLDQAGWYGSAFFLTLAVFQSPWGKIYKYYPIKSVYAHALNGLGPCTPPVVTMFRAVVDSKMTMSSFSKPYLLILILLQVTYLGHLFFLRLIPLCRRPSEVRQARDLLARQRETVICFYYKQQHLRFSELIALPSPLIMSLPFRPIYTTCSPSSIIRSLLYFVKYLYNRIYYCLRHQLFLLYYSYYYHNISTLKIQLYKRAYQVVPVVECEDQ